MTKPAHLRCEGLENPLAVDARHPRLSWTIAAETHDLQQVAYQILVAGSVEKLASLDGDLWDSGRIIAYDGTALKSRAGRPGNINDGFRAYDGDSFSISAYFIKLPDFIKAI